MPFLFRRPAALLYFNKKNVENKRAIGIQMKRKGTTRGVNFGIFY